MKVSSWYKTNGATPQTPVSPLPDLILALANGISGAAATSVHNGVTAADIQGTGLLSPNAQQFLSSQANSSTKPKAYLNWILFDEYFKFVSSSSGADPVGDNDVLTQHLKTDLPIDKNGYLYVYVSNETPNIPVFFDNLQVTHVKGLLTEETHYYPFGLTMAGISSKAAGGVDNKFKYNGKEEQKKEFSDGSGLDWLDYEARMFDNQIGRWWAVDPLSQDLPNVSPYGYCANNPIKFIDPDGRWFTLYYYEQNEDGSYKNVDKKGNPVASTITLKTMDDLNSAVDKSGGNGYVKSFVDAVSYIMKDGADQGLTRQLLEKDETVNIYNPYGAATEYTPQGNMLPWDPAKGLTFQKGNEAKQSSPAISLLHEFGHAYRDIFDHAYPENASDPNARQKYMNSSGDDEMIVRKYEQYAAKVLGVNTRNKYFDGASIAIDGGVTSTTPATGQNPVQILKARKKWHEEKTINKSPKP